VTAILPGATIGVIGGGQLARMLALEARRMGYRVAVQDPDPRGPAGQIADVAFGARFDDEEAALALARASDVVTIDIEQVPAPLLRAVEGLRPVHPSAGVMEIIQDRAEQRCFLQRHGFPQAAHGVAGNREELEAAAAVTGYPAVLKVTRQGYDGRGQARVEGPAELGAAWEELGRRPVVVERYLQLEREVSVVLARSAAGEMAVFPLAENLHRRHILHTTCVPARLPTPLARRATELGREIAVALDHVGVMTVEMFLTRDDQLLVNEIAPRTHNSGHFTFGACVTSQFEQHLRAICHLPLGDPALLHPTVMVNLLGDLWANGEPAWERVLAVPNVKLHLYGKSRPFPGRKMGHLLILDEDLERATRLADELLAALAAGSVHAP